MHVQSAVDATDDVPQTAHDSTRPPQRRYSIEVTSERDIMESTEELLFLEVRPPVFALIWFGMLAIHVFCGTVLVLQAQLYIYMTSPYLSYYVHLVKPNIVRKYKAVAAVFGALSAVHWTVVLRLCDYSITQRKFAFFPANYYDPPQQPKPYIGDADSSIKRSRVGRVWTYFSHRMHSCHVACFSRRGILGVEPPFFYLYFYLRECIKLTSQIYQAYRASLLVARPWLNNLSVAVIVVNCFSTPIVQYYYKKRPEMRCVYLLAIDAVLDFCVAIIVPLGIFAPYARAFDLGIRTFPSEKLYDHQWFINGVLENQEVFIISTLDLVFKITLHLSIRGCLKKVMALVRKDTSVVTPKDQHGGGSPKWTQFRERQLQAKAQAKAQIQAQGQRAHGSTLVVRLYTQSCRLVSRLIHKYAGKVIRLLFVGIGCSLICFHGLAFRTSYYGDKSGCCRRNGGIQGNASDVQQALAKLHEGSVAALLFTHCPMLEIPPIIRKYRHLLSIDIYNSTLVSWLQEATITHSTNPFMVSLSLVRVNFSNGGILPDGMISDDFPRGLFDIEISTTNLVDLPSNLHDKWPQMTRLYVENSGLISFPSTFNFLPVEKLPLEGNSIARLPEDLFFTQSFFVLALSNNPLVSMPTAADGQTYIRYLHAHRTNLSAFPNWVYDKLANGDIARTYAHDTPFCSQQTAQGTVSDSVDITCLSGEDADSLNDDEGLYPLAFMDKELGL